MIGVRTAVLMAIVSGGAGLYPLVTTSAHPSVTTCTYSSGTVRLHLASEHAVRLYVLEGRI